MNEITELLDEVDRMNKELGLDYPTEQLYKAVRALAARVEALEKQGPEFCPNCKADLTDPKPEWPDLIGGGQWAKPAPPEAQQEQRPRAAFYAAIMPLLIQAGRKAGWAIAAHGSFQRDLDLIAVPWEAACDEPPKLMEALRAACGGKLREFVTLPDGSTAPNPQVKPWGRMGWVIHLDGGAYIDVSITPGIPTPDQAELDRLRDLTRWRDAEMEGPGVGGKALVIDKDGTTAVGLPYACDGKWFAHVNQIGRAILRVRYWLPLPPLPQEGK